MENLYEFKATIKGIEKVDGAYVEFPFDTKELFNTNGKVKVAATFDGYKYRGILTKMGAPCHIIGITKAIRREIGKEVGDEIVVTIRKDMGSRLKEIPEILVKALDENAKAKEFFETLTESQKNKFITHITSAKREQTIKSRLDKCIIMLSNHEKMKQ